MGSSTKRKVDDKADRRSKKMKVEDGGKKQSFKKDKKAKKPKPVDSDVEMSDAEDEIEIVPKDPAYKVEESESEGSDLEGESPKKTENVNANKSREAHAQQKKIAAERKAAKPHADILTRGKRIWEQIRRKDINKDERKKLIEELCNLMKGRVSELVFKHDASRIVQTAVKYGTKEQRKLIAQELKGKYVELSQSAYGRYLTVKMMEYGTAETKDMVVKEMFGNVRKLIKHKLASIVVEDTWRQYATNKQKAVLLKEFYGVEFAIFKDEDGTGSLKEVIEKNPNKRDTIIKSLFELLKSLIDREALFYSIVHRAMLEYLLNARPGPEIEEFIELLKENVQHIAFSKEGARVVMRLLALSPAKERKVLLKQLKPIAADLASHKDAYLIVLTALDVVDDTKLSVKSTLPELEARLVDLACLPHGRVALLYPLIGRESRVIHPQIIAALAEMDVLRESTSKKDADVRRKEVCAAFAPACLKGITENAEALLADPYAAIFLTETLLAPIEDDKSAAISAVVEAVASSEDPSTLPVPCQRALKTLAQWGHFNPKTKTIERIPGDNMFAPKLAAAIKAEALKWATCGAGFVIVGLLEGGEWEGRKELVKTLKKGKGELEKAKEEGKKGAGVILESLDKE